MKKILFVIDSLISGGAEKSLISLLTIFDYQKYEVDLQMFFPDGLYLSLLPANVNKLEIPAFIEIQHHDIQYLIKNRKLKELFIRIGASVSLRNPYKKKHFHNAQITWKWMAKGIEKLNKKYDVAIAYSQGMPTYFVAERVEANKKLCFINTDYKRALYNRNFDEKFYNKFDYVVTVSEYSKTVFTTELPSALEKTYVIYDIISADLIRSMARQGSGFTDNFKGMRILTIGRLADAKGYDLAIEAAYKLKKGGCYFKWYVIGEGGLKNKLEAMVKEYGLNDYFIFIGTYHNPYVFLKQCDIYVQPSRFEGYGLAVAEARILLKPIIATNFPGVQNQINSGENGLIVDMNPDSLFTGIKDLLEDNALREYFSKNLINEKIGTEQEINKLYSLIEN